ncbi:GAF domain-containing sensor histidine kinase [Alkalinema sp. FACHB-956]|uniref:GAF domain-containing sensor histidine kinase n=1 Tax=Alkalinema sp. FACHB-956 TaxID=2692768 RepID=UPI001683253A|nr:GAF domain-containing sensor histidine kinase [Alkalinema sp. FACHB-956]MBD2327253.1 GAF domain-containing protein [Alkalinema sp. FACHB-956]
MSSFDSQEIQHYQRVLEYISALSYRSGELTSYLQEITLGVSSLLHLDWSVVTLCKDGYERVLASSVDLGEEDHVYEVHGTLTGTVIERGCPLVVEDTDQHPELGEAPEGYRSYLGVPLRTAQNLVIGTICSFHQTPRQFSQREVKVSELFAERAATAIDNYFLYKQQLEFNERLEAEVAIRTEELREAQAKLMEQERLAAIGEFAAIIVHEIRNPLTTVKMGLNAFKKLELTPAYHERLGLALGESQRLENLLSEILLYAKPQTLKLVQLDLVALLRGMLPTLREMPEAEDRSIDLIAEVPNLFQVADIDKLKQVLINIIRNACEATEPNGTVTCWLKVDPIAHTQQIQVHNPGPPIPPEVLAKLTQPFFSTKSGGTGLGLAISKRILDAHGATLTITSNTEQGTWVTIQFPLPTSTLV